MNKYVISLALASQVFFAQAAPANPFEKLTTKIFRNAQNWAEKATALDNDLPLVFLNLFALNSEDSIQAFIKCAEYIESQADMLALYEELGINIMETIRAYAENVQEKIALKSNLSDTEKETLWQKLETKIQELIAYINAIYYQTLYSNVAKRNTTPVYMFDENGIIAPEKRTRALPQLG
jgi:anaerobic ribonucleoside-triphosphate reductase